MQFRVYPKIVSICSDKDYLYAFDSEGRIWRKRGMGFGDWIELDAPFLTDKEPDAERAKGRSGD